jgi:hypothetical protein
VVNVPEGYRIRKRFRDDFLYYSPRALKIYNKQGKLVPFDLNHPQIFTHNILEKRLRTKGFIRARILKPRKMGISTMIEGRFYWKVSQRTGMCAMIMTEADTSRDKLFRMVKTYHDNMPLELKPGTKASNEKALVFDDDKGEGLNSRYDVKTCDSKGGKGIDTHYNHWSEAAYFSQSALDNLSGLLESIPSSYPEIMGTEVIEETTANGASGHFYDGWKLTEETIVAGHDPEYINIFFPWTFDKGYAIPVTDEQRSHILDTLCDEEKWLLMFINPDGSPVTIENLAWRRWKIQNIIAPIGFTKEDYFKQWYPMTPDEAFIYSGKSIFGTSDLNAAKMECFSPAHLGDFNYYGKFVPHDRGEVKVWQRPRINERYVIGADVAEGLQSEDRDYSCADVIRCSTGQQVAHIHCKKDPDLFGEALFRLGLYYNKALLGVEANNHGLTTITTLKKKNYPRQYQREMIDANASGRKQKKAGWLTTSKSKYKIIDQLVGIVRDHDTGIVNHDTIKEFENYSILEDGTYGGKPGCHDDRVMSYAIAYEMLLTMPRLWAEKEKRVREARTGRKDPELNNLKEAVVTSDKQ